MKSQGAAKNEANNAAQAAAAPAETAKVDFSNVKIEPIFEEMVDFDTFAKSDFRAVKSLACEAVKKSKKMKERLEVLYPNCKVQWSFAERICLKNKSH